VPKGLTMADLRPAQSPSALYADDCTRRAQLTGNITKRKPARFQGIAKGVMAIAPGMRPTLIVVSTVLVLVRIGVTLLEPVLDT
jgi:hypothetical protein